MGYHALDDIMNWCYVMSISYHMTCMHDCEAAHSKDGAPEHSFVAQGRHLV